MLGLFERYPEKKGELLKEIYSLINKYSALALVYDYEMPFLDYGNAVLREFVDITDSCRIFYEDKSRGSDYGD